MIGLIDPLCPWYRQMAPSAPHWAIAPVVSSSGSPNEPVDTVDMMTELRGAPDCDFDIVSSKIRAARLYLETRSRQILFKRQFDLVMDAPYYAEAIRVPFSPLASINTITGYGTTGDATPVSSSAFAVDAISTPGRLLIQPAGGWPFNLRHKAGLVVRFTAGYGNTANDLQGLHDPFIEAIKQLTTFLYEHRGDGADQFTMPAMVDELMADYWLPEAG